MRKDKIYAEFSLLHSEVSISHWDYYISKKGQIFLQCTYPTFNHLECKVIQHKHQHHAIMCHCTTREEVLFLMIVKLVAQILQLQGDFP